MILRALKHMHFAQHADNCQHTLQNAFGNERMIDEKRVLPLGAGTFVLTFVKPNLNMTFNIYIYIYIYGGQSNPAWLRQPLPHSYTARMAALHNHSFLKKHTLGLTEYVIGQLPFWHHQEDEWGRIPPRFEQL